MMKRLVIATLIVAILIGILAGTVNAATESELLNYLSKEVASLSRPPHGKL